MRTLMIGAGLWRSKRKRQMPIHPMRERRGYRGELIQIDGSAHDWFEGRAPRCTLLVFFDDATSELMALRFVVAEATAAYMQILRDYIHFYLSQSAYEYRRLYAVLQQQRAF